MASALWAGKSVVGITPELAWLPRDLVTSADRTLQLSAMDAAAASKTAERLLGGTCTVEMPGDLAQAVTPLLLRLARRRGQTADDYLRKLSSLVEARRGKPPAQREAAPRDAPLLSRLHGMDEAVAWGTALAADLAAYQDGTLAWADVDRGVLLSGPPGTGKTTFGRALAATCGVPLVQGSYSSWLANGDAHQGNLLKAMKETFAKARESAPCILFIDETDSFPDRDKVSNHHKCWEVQVVNALLAEVDGATGREGVVIVGACNDPDRVDPALRRSGRLDRHIAIGLPTLEALVLILREHLGDDLAGDDLAGMALLALGSTGADVERFVRGARRVARTSSRAMKREDLLAEIGGREERSEGALRLAAVHEAGHVVAAVEFGFPVAGVNLRSDAIQGGAVSMRAGRGHLTAADVHTRLTLLLAGRAAEEVLLNRISSGAGGGSSSDLARATALATVALCQLGLDDDHGLVWTSMPDIEELRATLAADRRLAAVVRQRLADAYSSAVTLVSRQSEAVEDVAEALLARSALGGDEVLAVVRRSFVGRRL